MRSWTRAQRAWSVAVLCALVCASAACGGIFRPQYEYEEELYLALDGSVTLNLNASAASLVALRGLDLPVDPRARLDREDVRRAFEAPGSVVTRVSLSRREGRRFVHVSVDAADVRALPTVLPFAWSSYRFDGSDPVRFRQTIGRAAGKDPGDVGWTGQEIVVFRLHVPSEIPFHNSPAPIQRGNILMWEQPLAERLKSVPIDIEVDMEPNSILYATLLLFGFTIVAAGAVFAAVIWWVTRRGRDPDAVTPGSH